MGNRFEAGDRVLLVDSRGRRYMVTLQAGGRFHFHRGIIDHDDLIGQGEGRRLRATSGELMIVLRPTYADFILKMKRGAQVVYPKDVAAILSWADIHPGAVVLEAGTGSGALTIGLLLAVGPQGSVVSYEARQDHLDNARCNIEAFMGKTENLELVHGSIYEPIAPLVADRCVLDLAEPWQALPQVMGALRPGGICCCYLPTILQSSQLTEELQGTGRWTSITTLETLVRTWHIEGRSVRPDHRMVAHTGFLTVARLLADTQETGQKATEQAESDR